MNYAFNNCELDTRLYELRRDGKVVPLEPLAFKVLTYLVQHRDHAVSKDELIEHLWSGQFMSDAVLVQSVVKARRAIGDNGHAQRCIKTIMSHGYRFIASVEEYEAVGYAVPALAPIPLRSESPHVTAFRAVGPRQGEEGVMLRELFLADQVRELAMVRGLLGEMDGNQAQTVVLVIHLERAQTAHTTWEPQFINAASHAF